jgi:hypothetical protein
MDTQVLSEEEAQVDKNCDALYKCHKENTPGVGDLWMLDGGRVLPGAW